MDEVLTAPWLHSGDCTRTRMLDAVIALLPAAAGAVWYSGWPAALVLGLASLSALAFEMLFARLQRRAPPGDGSALVSGLLLGLMLPSGCPWWAVLAGSLAAMSSKAFSGGLGRNFWNPAALGRAVLLAVPALRDPPLRQAAGHFLMGYTGGSLAEVSSLLLLAGAVYLLLRRLLQPQIAASALVAAFLTALCIPRCDPLAVTAWGGTILMACFLTADPVTSPMSLGLQALYGAACGAVCTLLAYYVWSIPGLCLGILCMNLLFRLAEWLPLRAGKSSA